MKRPLGVTVVGVLIILLAAFEVLGVIHLSVHRPAYAAGEMMVSRDPVPPLTQHAVGFLFGIVEFIAGILILRGWDLGRTVYAVIGAIALVFAFATVPVREPLLLNLVIFAFFLYVLYQPNASLWFERSAA